MILLVMLEVSPGLVTLSTGLRMALESLYKSLLVFRSKPEVGAGGF